MTVTKKYRRLSLPHVNQYQYSKASASRCGLACIGASLSVVAEKRLLPSHIGADYVFLYRKRCRRVCASHTGFIPLVSYIQHEQTEHLQRVSVSQFSGCNAPSSRSQRKMLMMLTHQSPKLMEYRKMIFCL